MHQPDIEIYLKDADLDTVGQWLQQVLGSLQPWQQKGKSHQTRAGAIPVSWIPKAVGRWHSLLLESDATPWENDLACARAAHQALQVEIRCAPGGWLEGETLEQADHWIRIDAEGEREFIWRTD